MLFRSNGGAPQRSGNDSNSNEIPFATAAVGLPKLITTMGPKIDPKGYDPCDGMTNKQALEAPHGPTGDPYYSYAYSENLRLNGKTSDDYMLDDAISGYGSQSHERGAAGPESANVLPPSNFIVLCVPSRGQKLFPKP